MNELERDTIISILLKDLRSTWSENNDRRVDKILSISYEDKGRYETVIVTMEMASALINEGEFDGRILKSLELYDRNIPIEGLTREVLREAENYCEFWFDNWFDKKDGEYILEVDE